MISFINNEKFASFFPIFTHLFHVSFEMHWLTFAEHLSRCALIGNCCLVLIEDYLHCFGMKHIGGFGGYACNIMSH